MNMVFLNCLIGNFYVLLFVLLCESSRTKLKAFSTIAILRPKTF